MQTDDSRPGKKLTVPSHLDQAWPPAGCLEGRPCQSVFLGPFLNYPPDFAQIWGKVSRAFQRGSLAKLVYQTGLSELVLCDTEGWQWIPKKHVKLTNCCCECQGHIIEPHKQSLQHLDVA